eukprot:4887710-Amphidinium_carterae.1
MQELCRELATAHVDLARLPEDVLPAPKKNPHVTLGAFPGEPDEVRPIPIQEGKCRGYRTPAGMRGRHRLYGRSSRAFVSLARRSYGHRRR